MTGIKNYDFYTTEMGRAMMDKLFFLHHIDATYFVDYGCADGQMIKAISSLVGGEFCGYDTDSQMINLAKERSVPFALFTDDWEKVKFDIAFCTEYTGQKSCLVLSSIIHEIYSYGNEDSIKEFWNRVFNSGFDYVVIRDMAMSENNKFGLYSHEIFTDFLVKVDLDQYTDFIDQWGHNSIEDSTQGFMHFLLKYRYKDNWEREVKENYFPLTVEQVNYIRKNIGRKYEQIFFNHFSVPFIRKQINKDFGIDAPWETHYKAILELKK